MRRAALGALDRDTFLAHHRAVLRGDTKARETLSADLLSRVYRTLIRRMPATDPTLINDAVEDAILAYLENPNVYDPARSRLDTFITMAAAHRALNALRSQKRRIAAEERFGTSLITTPTPNHVVARESRIGDQIRRVVVNRSEHEFLLARNAGVRRTQDLASVLGVMHLPVSEQRRVVKRLTERLRARLRRLSRSEQQCWTCLLKGVYPVQGPKRMARVSAIGLVDA
jgi:RNA polymerase sigma-70 factor (ECF subfamily)